MDNSDVIRVFNMVVCMLGIIPSVLWVRYAYQVGRDWRAIVLYTLPINIILIARIIYTVLFVFYPVIFTPIVFTVINNSITMLTNITLVAFVLGDGFYWYKREANGRYKLGGVLFGRQRHD